jgi:hypothetical protein
MAGSQSRRLQARLSLATVVGLSCGVGAGFSATYDELRAAAIKTCQAIDPAEYRSGLIGNPDGYRSYYVQSECFQRVAVEFRDNALCSRVRRRYSFFSSSWGYSTAQCEKLVAEGAAADRATVEDIKRRYLQGPVRLREFRVERHGNGRDFDIIPLFSDGFAHSYVLQLDILAAGGTVLLDRSSFHLTGRDEIRLFVRQSDLVRRFPELTRNQPYTVRATLVLDVGHGGPSGHWSDTFLERVFPVRERSQSLEREVRF